MFCDRVYSIFTVPFSFLLNFQAGMDLYCEATIIIIIIKGQVVLFNFPALSVYIHTYIHIYIYIYIGANILISL